MGQRFCFSAEEVAAQKREGGLSDLDLLTRLVADAARVARPPISKFQVGAAGLGSSGAIYLGINLEFPGTPLSNSVHAEQFLVANAIHHGETELCIVAVNAGPCGHCRQFLAELHNSERLRLVFTTEGKREWGLTELLPMRFKPQHVLGDAYTALLMAPRERLDLRWSEAALKLLQQNSEMPHLTQAAEMALHEACQSYAPYSQSPSGASIMTKEGGIYAGGCLENCAYNPTLPPLQSAIIHAISRGKLESYTEIEFVVLAELEATPNASHEASTKALVRAMAPQATFIALSLERSR